MPRKHKPEPGDIYECTDGSVYMVDNEYKVRAIYETGLGYDPSLYDLPNVEKFLNILIGHVKD